MDDLISDWRAARTEWAAASAGVRPVKDCNLIMDRIWKLSHEIANRPELHERVASLCSPDQDADLRVGAALVLEHWDVEGAAQTLVSVIHDSGEVVTRPMTMAGALTVKSTTTARTAALCLLNIDDGRGNTGAVS